MTKRIYLKDVQPKAMFLFLDRYPSNRTLLNKCAKDRIIMNRKYISISCYFHSLSRHM